VTLFLEEGIKKPPKESLKEEKDAAFSEMIMYALEQPASEGLYLRGKDALARPVEAEMLDQVASFIDFGLANDISGLKITDNSRL